MKLYKPARSSFKSATVKSPRVRSTSRIPKLTTMKNPVVKIPKYKAPKAAKMGTIKI